MPVICDPVWPIQVTIPIALARRAERIPNFYWRISQYSHDPSFDQLWHLQVPHSNWVERFQGVDAWRGSFLFRHWRIWSSIRLYDQRRNHWSLQAVDGDSTRNRRPKVLQKVVEPGWGSRLARARMAVLQTRWLPVRRHCLDFTYLLPNSQHRIWPWYVLTVDALHQGS